MSPLARKIAIPLAFAFGGGLGALLGHPRQTTTDTNCLDLVDRPIAIFLDNTFVRATAHKLGPGWVIIPNPPR